MKETSRFQPVGTAMPESSAPKTSTNYTSFNNPSELPSLFYPAHTS